VVQAPVLSPDLTSIATNLGIFSLFIGAAVTGIWKALKNLRSEEGSPEAGHRVASAALVETTTIVMWSETNRDVTQALHRLCDQMTELTHQVERLRDKM